jgi:hypothetical protein
MTAAITAAVPAAPGTPEVEREILTRIARGGLLICETELRYQLHRHGHERADLLAVLANLEQQGSIESEIHYRLTPSGAARVPTSHRPAPGGISSIPWSSASARTARAPGVPSQSPAATPRRPKRS